MVWSAAEAIRQSGNRGYNPAKRARGFEYNRDLGYPG